MFQDNCAIFCFVLIRFCSIRSSISNFRLLLAQIGDTADDLSNMSIQVRIEDSRPLRIVAPTSGHCKRDSHREHSQGIKRVDIPDRRVRTRVLVELGGGQGVQPERCRRCEQADESVHCPAASISANCPLFFAASAA